MRRNETLKSLHGLITAAILAIAAVGLAWLCVRTTAVEVLPPDTTAVASLAPRDPGSVLAREAIALVRQHGILTPSALAHVRAATIRAPLDARAFLILGHQQLLDRQPVRAIRTFEAGQRLDPRNDLLHILLLDSYWRAGRYADAATQMAVAARLMSPAAPAAATAMAAMAVNPATSGTVRRALDADPGLEQAVLAAMAASNVPPPAIFAFASPAARTAAGVQGGWGETLIARQVEQGRFALAREVWRRVYHQPSAIAAASIVDPEFASPSPPPPFGWTLTEGSIGAADLRNGALAVDYYGRDSGDLASQLLVLAPGRYRLGFTVDPGKTDAAARLFWSIACATGTKPTLVDIAVVAGPSPHRLLGEIVVPAGCSAQTLTLRGEAGDLPASTSAAVRDLELKAIAGARP